ncbi:GYF_domain [Hexamita inflata]|uniref:GYF domain n=1 Tax=Hexamita inflata TaxID=28002 RepID=A0AA86Q4M1_9EUKA|nr:GYF domain [Hexamita inflata]
MSDSESSSTSSSSEPDDTAQSSYMSKQTQIQAHKQTQNTQQESSISDDAEFQKNMKQSNTVFNEVKRCGFSNAVVQTGKGYCVQNGIVFTRPFTVPTIDKQTQKNENDEIEEEQNKINENQTEEQKGTLIQQESNQTIQSLKETNQKETDVEEFETKTKDERFVLEESESIKEEQESESVPISESDEKSNQEENKRLEAEKLKQQEQVEESPKSNINHTGQSQMNEQLIKKQPTQTQPNRSQKSAWFYIDSKNIRQGPYTSVQMNAWNLRQKLPLGLKIQQGLGEFFTLSQEHIKMSNFFQDYDEINIDQIINNSRQYECMLAHAETQTGLNEIEISIAQTRHYFSKLVIPPSVEKCINTELSLMRGNQDKEYIVNNFTTYRDVQAVEVGDHAGVRVPIIKKEQKDQKESIFAPEANLNPSLNTDLNPEKQKNETEKPKIDKAHDYFTDPDNPNVYSQCQGIGLENSKEDNAREQFNQENANREQNNYQQQLQNHPYAATTNDLFPTNTVQNNQNIKSTQGQINQDESKQETNTGTKSNIINSNQSQAELQSVTNLLLANKSLLFEPILLIAINKYYQDLPVEKRTDPALTEFKTLEEALIFYRKCIVGVNDVQPQNQDKIKGSKIHLNFKQIAQECGMSEKDCRQRFQTLLANELQEWPQESVNQINQRIQQLSQQFPELSVEEKKTKIRQLLDEEFQLRQQVQYSYKEITNKINYQLKKFVK